MQTIFNDIYENDKWGGADKSGNGSTLEATEVIREQLPLLFDKYNISSMLDIPCGSLNWISQVKFPKGFRYIGADIVPALIDANINQLDIFEDGWFDLLDITRDKLPKVDLILVRDLLGHFTNANVKLALKNIKASGSKYLLATTFPLHETPNDIKTGEWRPINLASMWGLPDPLEYINEECDVGGGAFADKSLGLWQINGGS